MQKRKKVRQRKKKGYKKVIGITFGLARTFLFLNIEMKAVH